MKKVFLTFIMGLILVPSIGQTKTANDYLEEAKEFLTFREKKPDGGYNYSKLKAGADLLDSALIIDPNFKEAYFIKGLLGYSFGFGSTWYEEQLDKAIELNPDNETFKNVEDLIEHYDRNVYATYYGKIPTVDNGLIYSMKTFYAYQRKSQKDAEAYYDKSVSIDPTSPFYLINRANYLKSQGKFKSAIEDLQKAIALDSNYFYGWYEFGQTLAFQMTKTFPESQNENGFEKMKTPLVFLDKKFNSVAYNQKGEEIHVYNKAYFDFVLNCYNKTLSTGIFDVYPNSSFQANSYWALYELYKRMGKKEEGCAYLEKSVDLGREDARSECMYHCSCISKGEERYIEYQKLIKEYADIVLPNENDIVKCSWCGKEAKFSEMHALTRGVDCGSTTYDAFTNYIFCSSACKLKHQDHYCRHAK